MEQEKDWWVEEVKAICRYMKIADDQVPGLTNFVGVLITEATRRGIQQGKREAWEDAISLAFGFGLRSDKPCHEEEIIEAFKERLSSLSDSSKDKV